MGRLPKRCRRGASSILWRTDNVRTFHVALTGDFLDETGRPAYGDNLALLRGRPFIECHYLTEQAPRPGDPGYWRRFYSLEVEPRHLVGVDGLVVLRPAVKRGLFAHGAADLVAVGRSGAGYDKIDVAAYTEHAVALFNAPLALNHATASSALLFMLALAKRLPQQERVARQGRWELQASVMGGELQGRTLGVIGLGHSGRELVRLVAPFAMRVLAHSPHADPAQAQARALGVALTSLEELLREADFVSLHCRLTPENHHLLNAPRVALMKPGAHLINVARGELVEQGALVEARREGRIAGAGLDVFEEEPLPADDALTKLDNVLLTPTGRPRLRTCGPPRAGRWPRACSRWRRGECRRTSSTPRCSTCPRSGRSWRVSRRTVRRAAPPFAFCSERSPKARQRKGPFAVTGVHEDAVGLVARVHPHHRHRPVRAVEKAMRPAARNASGIAVRQRLFPPRHLANGGPGDDGDRLVELVIVAREGRPRLEQSIAATNASRAESPIEQVAEERSGGQLVDHCRLEAHQALRGARLGLVPLDRRKLDRDGRASWGVGGERGVEHGGAVGREVANRVRRPRGQVHRVERAKPVTPALDENGGLALHDHDRFAERVQVVGKLGPGAKMGQGGGQSLRSQRAGGEQANVHAGSELARERAVASRQELGPVHDHLPERLPRLVRRTAQRSVKGARTTGSKPLRRASCSRR